MKYCTACGSSMNDDADFCPQCGTRCGHGAPAGPSVSQPNTGGRGQAQDKEVAQKTGVLVASVAGFLVVLMVLVLSSGQAGTGSASGTYASTAASKTATSSQESDAAPAKTPEEVASEKKKAEKEEAAKKKAEEEAAAAQKKAEEEAAARAAAQKQSFSEAHDATLAQVGAHYKGFALTEMSGDDYPEIVFMPYTDSSTEEHANYPVYSYDPNSGTMFNAGSLSVNFKMGSATAIPGGHDVYLLEADGVNGYFWQRAAVRDGSVVIEEEGHFPTEGHASDFGLEPLSYHDPANPSVVVPGF